MKKALHRFAGKGGLKTYTLKYYSSEVEAAWTFDDEDVADPSLQAVYSRSYTINGEAKREENFLYFTPEDAAAIGAILTSWAAAHGEKV